MHNLWPVALDSAHTFYTHHLHSEHPTTSNGFTFVHYVFLRQVDNKVSEKINDLLQTTWEDWSRARICTSSFSGPSPSLPL